MAHHQHIIIDTYMSFPCFFIKIEANIYNNIFCFLKGLLQKHSQELTNLISEKEKQLLEMENLNFTIETFVRKTEASTNSHNGIKGEVKGH